MGFSFSYLSIYFKFRRIIIAEKYIYSNILSSMLVCFQALLYLENIDKAAHSNQPLLRVLIESMKQDALV